MVLFKQTIHMIIRRETETDFERIYELIKVAFQTAKVADGNEQDFANQLRTGTNYIPELALAAADRGQLIGHIMLTKNCIDQGNGQLFEALLLAPLAVELAYRSMGVGSKLINESFRLAKEMGYRAVFVVGDPAYYQRFGFKSSVHWGIKNTHNIPDEYVMACELIPGALQGVNGTISF